MSENSQLAAGAEFVPQPQRLSSDENRRKERLGSKDSDATQVADSASADLESKTSSDAGYLYQVDKYEPLAPRSDVGPTPGGTLLRWLGLRKAVGLPDLDAIATQESAYDGPLGSHYRPPADWENAGAFDATLRWTYREERKATRKCDWIILLWMSFMFFALDIDRGNISNATAGTLLEDLNLTQADYNLGNTLFRVGFLVAELPSQIIGKRFGVDIWLPTQMCIFSILAMSQFAMQGRTSFLALRFLIAFFQGGFIPDSVLYLSYYYTKNELPVRLAFFWVSNYLTSIVTGFLGAGLLQISAGGHSGWRWMFLIEGLLTLLVGFASFIVLRPGPSETKSRWLPNGYFSDREVKIIVNKVARDDPGKSSMHNREALTPQLLWSVLKEWDLWPLYFIGFMFGIPGYPTSNYFSLSMKKLGFSTIQTNLLSIPNVVISIFNLVLVTIASELFNSRTWLCTVENWWFLVFYIVFKVVKDPSAWEYFAIATLLLGWPYVHAIQVGWVSRNSGHVSTRTISASIYNICVQLSAIAGANVFQASDDPPHYPKGITALLVIIAFNLAIMYPGTYIYYRWRNSWKERKWNSLSLEEQSEYLRSTTDRGTKRLDFRFAY